MNNSRPISSCNDGATLKRCCNQGRRRQSGQLHLNRLNYRREVANSGSNFSQRRQQRVEAAILLAAAAKTKTAAALILAATAIGLAAAAKLAVAVQFAQIEILTVLREKFWRRRRQSRQRQIQQQGNSEALRIAIIEGLAAAAKEFIIYSPRRQEQSLGKSSAKRGGDLFIRGGDIIGSVNIE